MGTDSDSKQKQRVKKKKMKIMLNIVTLQEYSQFIIFWAVLFGKICLTAGYFGLLKAMRWTQLCYNEMWAFW